MPRCFRHHDNVTSRYPALMLQNRHFLQKYVDLKASVFTFSIDTYTQKIPAPIATLVTNTDSFSRKIRINLGNLALPHQELSVSPANAY